MTNFLSLALFPNNDQTPQAYLTGFFLYSPGTLSNNKHSLVFFSKDAPFHNHLKTSQTLAVRDGTRDFLWSATHSMLTALQRSIINLEDCKILHKPFSNSYILETQAKNQECLEIAPNPELTYQAVHKMIKEEYKANEVLFIKHLTRSVLGRLTDFLSDDYAEFRHTFLLRSPKKALPSVYRILSSNSVKRLTFDDFNLYKLGAIELHKLYRFVTSKIDPEPVEIDPDDLIDNPQAVVRRYCENVGLRFASRMLSWKPDLVLEWEKCQSYHEVVIESSGFQRQNFGKTEAEDRDQKLPDMVLQAIDDSMPYYEALYKVRLCHK